nr:hypothetical protein [Polymorphobacter sp.]
MSIAVVMASGPPASSGGLLPGAQPDAAMPVGFAAVMVAAMPGVPEFAAGTGNEAAGMPVVQAMGEGDVVAAGDLVDADAVLADADTGLRDVEPKTALRRVGGAPADIADPLAVPRGKRLSVAVAMPRRRDEPLEPGCAGPGGAVVEARVQALLHMLAVAAPVVAEGVAQGADRGGRSATAALGWLSANVAAGVVSVSHDLLRGDADGMQGVTGEIPAVRMPFEVVDMVPSTVRQRGDVDRLAVPLLQADVAMADERPRDAPTADAADDGGSQILVGSAGVAAARFGGDAVVRVAVVPSEAAKAAVIRSEAAGTAAMVNSQSLGEVRIALEGGAQDLRVKLAVGSGAAAVVADAPRLAADLAANGVRLQSLDVSGGGAAMSSGGGWNAPAGGEGRPRFVSQPGAMASEFSAEQAGQLPTRGRAASDRYA